MLISSYILEVFQGDEFVLKKSVTASLVLSGNQGLPLPCFFILHVLSFKKFSFFLFASFFLLDPRHIEWE